MIRFLGFLCLLFLFSFSNDEQPKRLAWESDRKLQWSDFEAPADDLLPYAATANSGMSHSYAITDNGEFLRSTSEVKAHFYPEFSWYKSKDTTAVILAHEQSHFDITEIHARKFRKRIEEFEFTTNAAVEVRELYDLTENERMQMQNRFDKESQHSLNAEAELFWKNQIARLLEKLDYYAE